MNPWPEGHPAHQAQAYISVVEAAVQWQLHPTRAYQLLCEIHRRVTTYRRLFTQYELQLWTQTSFGYSLSEQIAETLLDTYHTRIVQWREYPLVRIQPGGLPRFPQIIFSRAALSSLLGVPQDDLTTLMWTYASWEIRDTLTSGQSLVPGEVQAAPYGFAARTFLFSTRTGLPEQTSTIILQRLDSLQGYYVRRLDGDTDRL